MYFARVGYDPPALMSRPARTLFAFGLYVVLTGLIFLTVPDVLIATLRLPPSPPGWPRIVGILALVIGTYDLVGSHSECLPYIKASVAIRFAFAAAMTILFLTRQMPVTVVAFGAVDAAGAVWTWATLKKRAKGEG
jgi:hypothetical protein